jgi:hypothetical protein
MYRAVWQQALSSFHATTGRLLDGTARLIEIGRDERHHEKRPVAFHFLD